MKQCHVLSRQGDLFANDQPDSSDEDFETPVYESDPEERRRVAQDSCRGVGSKDHALDASKASLYRTIFPQMTNWLPEEEGAQLRFEFETEMERLQAA